jgi:predicted nucleic acid-binding protein
MLYFDTSFLVPLILEESTSAKIEKFLRSRRNEELAVSHWTRVEFSSLLAREVRMGGLRPKAAIAADAQFESVINESFAVLLPSADDFNVSKEFLQRHKTGLRAGDALHLAIAANSNAQTIYSLDRTFLQAGRKLGLPVRRGIRLP